MEAACPECEPSHASQGEPACIIILSGCLENQEKYEKKRRGHCETVGQEQRLKS